MPGRHAEDSVGDCITSVMEDNPDLDEESAARICQDTMKAREAGYEDPRAVAVVSYRKKYGVWPGVHPSEKSADGREHLLASYGSKAEKLAKEPETEEKSIKFKARLTGGVQNIWKSDDGRFVIWGPASVEVVDKENDKIKAEALKEALPQLLRRERLSLEHSDQLVGDIKESFETEEPVTVKFNGHEVTRTEFPTDVLELDGMEPSLYVAGEIWDDTRQARQARKDIESGEIDSYSISGEAIASSTKVKDGEVFDEISELDLSAVTLCEEGMNEKAKFGVVSKEEEDPTEGDDAERQSTPKVQVVKRQTDSMTQDNEDEKSAEDPEVLELEALRSNLKEAAEEALSEADFATTEEVKSIAESVYEEKQHPSDHTEDTDEAGEAADNVSEAHAPEEEDDEEMSEEDYDDYEDETDEEKAEDEDVEDAPEPVDEDDSEEEKNLQDPAVQEAIQHIADAYPDLSTEEVEDSLRGLVEGADDDEQVVPEDEEMEMAEAGGSYSHEELKQKLPDDLYEAAKEYLSEPEAGEEVVEMEDDEVIENEAEEETEDVSKSTDGYLTEVSSGVGLPSVDEDETEPSVMKGEEVPDADEAPDTLDALYQELGEPTQA